MYKGALTGFAEYTDKAGNEWKAWFNNDLKHGLCIIKHVGDTVQISTSFNGQYHGFLTFWLNKSNTENVRYQNGRVTSRMYVKENNAFYEKDGRPLKAIAENCLRYV